MPQTQTTSSPETILVTGANGYIGKRLIPALLESGYEVICCVRDTERFDRSRYPAARLKVIEVDFLKPETLDNIPRGVDAVYYLIHSMTASNEDFQSLERDAAINARNRFQEIGVRQVIYLSGITNQKQLSRHLSSRQQVEKILADATYSLTTLRAGIIVGSGSASFEIIRDLVEKLPVMIAPRWIDTRTQPIAIRNVIQFLGGVLLKPEFMGKAYDIGGPDILSYRELIEIFARVRGLRRKILSVPVLTPRLSSYWLYFVTSTSYNLAVSLVDSMMVEVIASPNNLHEKLGIELISYDEAIRLAFERIEQHDVPSSWIDASSSRVLEKGIQRLVKVPVHGCYKDRRTVRVTDRNKTIEKIWKIGGEQGWYYADRLWELRGFLDKLSGGVGLRRGRKHPDLIETGDSLDFWRVLHADYQQGRLLLYAEMRLPGEAWLDFFVSADGELVQTATFRPLGIAGRLYWFTLLPFHGFIFQGMLQRLAS